MSVKLVYNPEKPQFELSCSNYVIVGRHLIFHLNNMIDVYDLKTVYVNVGSQPEGRGTGPIPFDAQYIPKEGTVPIFSAFLSTNYELEGIPVDVQSFAADRVRIWCEDKVQCKEMIITITVSEITVKVAARTLYVEFTLKNRQNGSNESEARRLIREAFDTAGLGHLELPYIEYASRDRCYCFTIDSYEMSLSYEQFIKLYHLFESEGMCPRL